MYSIDFANPWYLLLLAIVPVMWWLSYGSLSGLGGFRRIVALGLRSLVFSAIVCALAEMQWVRSSENLTVLYLVDQSLSVSPQQNDVAVKYVNEVIRKQRGHHATDKAGVIIFGRDAAIELAPLDDDQRIDAVESMVDREYTNLAGAMKLAQASFTHDAAKRVVIISDGNENIGDALEQARGLSDAGVGIDVVPIRSSARGEVAVDKVAIPSDVRKGDPFDLRIVLNNSSPPGGPNGGQVSGKLQVLRKTGDHEQMLAEQSVTLPPGKKVLSIRESIESPDFYTYEARFVPDNPADDSMPQNNVATTFTHVRGSGQVLLIEDFENRGEYDLLVERLRALNLEVTVRSTRPEDMFTDLGQLQPYDTVILANVPREHFTDEQIQMLVRNTQNLGSGLVMLGGPNSFGAGGWNNTPVEEAMPVDFQIKSAKVAPVGALALLMHASEMADGNHWQKVIAREAIKTLGNQDYCGVLHWTGNDVWLWDHPKGMSKVGVKRNQMLALLDRMTPGDMPAFEPALLMARKAFAGLPDAATKHMIIISDGDPVPPNAGTVTSLKKLGVKISTVGVGTHGPPNTNPLQSIASQTGGKFYQVTNANMLPRIYQKEARRVARPLVFEQKAGFQPQIDFPHEMTQGIAQVLPPITGFVMTTKKESPLVEVSLVSPVPTGKENSTILASWTYGLGKTVAFTSDAGKRWATQWTGWEGFDKLFSQIVRWSMRPVGDSGKFTVTTDVQDGKIKVIVTALDKDDDFLNFLDIGGTIVGPDMKPLDLPVKQVAPGRYIGEVDAKNKGSYFVMLSPGPGRAPIRAGVNIPYSDEFRSRDTNDALLTTLASLPPKQGPPGKVIEEPLDVRDPSERVAKMLETDTFRHDLPKATSSQDVWQYLVLFASCLFFFDVFVRRVTVSFTWVGPLAMRMRNALLSREAAPVATPTMDRLRSRKAEVGDQLEQKRAATRFDPIPDAPVNPDALKEVAASATPREAPAGSGSLAPEKEKTEESYTSRLLKAKQKVWEERKQDENKPNEPPGGSK